MSIRINHGIWVSGIGVPLLRKGWNFEEKSLDKGISIDIPFEFRKLIASKVLKWKAELVEFTVGHDEEKDNWAIAIVHPKDHFTRKIGYAIVSGRLRRMREPAFNGDYECDHPTRIFGKKWIKKEDD